MVNRGPNRLVLHPERCDRCRACVSACPENAVKVTSAHLYVDWRKCDGCLACVESCGQGAIEAVAALQAVAGGAGASAMLVGSRAEVKALRKRAEDEQRRRKQIKIRNARAEVRAEKSATREHAVSEDGVAQWTIVDAVIVASVLLGLLFLKDVVLGTRWVHLLPVQAAVWARVGVLAVFYLVQIGVLAWRADRHGLGFVKAFGLGRMKRGWTWHLTSVAITAGLLLAARLFTTAYAAVAIRLGLQPVERLTGNLTELFGAGWQGFVIAMALVVMAAPFIEELVFRGVVQGAFSKWGGWVAVLGSSVLFAAYHLTLFWFVPYVVLGSALGWLAWARRGLWPSIALHATYNAVAVVAAYWFVSGR